MQTTQADHSPNSQVSHAKDQIRSEFNFPFILFRKLKLSVCILGSNTSGVTFESFYCICFSYLQNLLNFKHLYNQLTQANLLYFEIEFNSFKFVYADQADVTSKRFWLHFASVCMMSCQVSICSYLALEKLLRKHWKFSLNFKNSDFFKLLRLVQFSKFNHFLWVPYARHYKPRLIFFFTQFSLQLRPRRGVTEEVPAVGFCLGSGLFGSYNSD